MTALRKNILDAFTVISVFALIIAWLALPSPLTMFTRTILIKGNPRHLTLPHDGFSFEWGEAGDIVGGQLIVTPTTHLTFPGFTFIIGPAKNSGMFPWTAPDHWGILLISHPAAFTLAATLPTIQSVLWLVRAQRRTRHRLQQARTTRRIQSGQCPTCAYNLTANTSGACPECGTPTIQPPSAVVSSTPQAGS